MKKTFKGMTDNAKVNNRKLKSLTPIIAIILLSCFACLIYFTSPQAALITTGRYGQGTIEENKTVDSILGEEYAKERFELYFQWYNILHETGHVIVWFNSDKKPYIVDEEQLVNDFAVAFWTYYGEEKKLDDLEFIVSYALENIVRPADESTTHLDFARANWGKSDFFTFNNYGWFQFSCVNKSLSETKSLESVLTEMGVKNITIQPQQTLSYPFIGENTTEEIIGDAVSVLREWGAVIPDVYHTFDNNPNNHMVQIKRNVFGYLDKLYTPASLVDE